MSRRAQIIPPAERLGLSRPEAADYLGISPFLFDQMVKDGRMPPAKQINGRRVWDRRRLELAFSALPGDEAFGQNETVHDPYADVAV